MSTPAANPATPLDPDAHFVPTREQRDEHGRRIALSFDSILVQPAAPPAGSVAQKVIQTVRGSVLVVRAPAAPKEPVA